jgi:nitrilase
VPSDCAPIETDFEPGLYHETGEASSRASQFMAIEGQTFVLVASQVLTEENLEKNNLVGNHVTKTVSFRPSPCSVQLICAQPGGGFSNIFGPESKALWEPVDPGWEGVPKADNNLRDIDYAKTFIDVTGHYS